MQGKTHRYGGLALGAVASLAVLGDVAGLGEPVFMGTLLAGSTLGSLIPDLDHRHSELSKKVKPLGLVVSSVCKHRGFTHTGLAWFLVTLICGFMAWCFNSVVIDPSDWTTKFSVGVLFTALFIGIFRSTVKFTRIKMLYRIKKSFKKMALLTGICLLLTTLLAPYLVQYIKYYLIGISIGYLSHLLLDMLTVSGVPLMYPYNNTMYRMAKLTTGEDDKWVGFICLVIFFVALMMRLFV